MHGRYTANSRLANSSLIRGAFHLGKKNPEISVGAKVEFPTGKKLFHLVVNPGSSLCPTVAAWNWYKLLETGNASVKSKFQLPPPGQPLGHLTSVWELLFKFPPTQAKMPFKCPTLGSIQVIKCPHPGDISQAHKLTYMRQVKVIDLCWAFYCCIESPV